MKIARGIIKIMIIAKFWLALFIYHPQNLMKHLSSNKSLYLEQDRAKFQLGGIDLPTKKVIILRLDDVQEFLYKDATIKIIDTVLNRNMAITLGVIPSRIDHDCPIKKYIIGKVNDQRIEIAQHGVYHNLNEYVHMNESDTYNLTKLGMKTILDSFNVNPVTFIPPHNLYNKYTTKAISMLGFKIISAKRDEYIFDEYLVHIGYTVPTAHKNKLVNLDEVLYSCNISLEARNICVIMIHPQDYVDENNNLEREKYKKFIELLDMLSKLDAYFLTFKDLIRT